MKNIKGAERAALKQATIDNIAQIKKEIKAIKETPSLAKAFDIFVKIANRPINIPDSIEDPLELLEKMQDVFVQRVLDYSRCDDRVSLPSSYTVQKEVMVDDREIRKVLDEQTLKGNSVSIGVCAQVLARENDEVCGGGHAVAVKKSNEKSYLVVDSSFFSARKKEADGATWIPKEVVVLAIKAFGKKLQGFSGDGANTFSIIKIYREFVESQGIEAFKNVLRDTDSITKYFAESYRARIQSMPMENMEDFEKLKVLYTQSQEDESSPADKPANMIWLD